MKFTWLGQGGFLIEYDGFKTMVDPYLSHSVEQSLNPMLKRMIPIDRKYLEIKPNVLICTHDHLDHTDPHTLEYLLKESNRTEILAPTSSWEKIRNMKYEQHNVTLFDQGTEVTMNCIRYKAIKAIHSDFHAIGVLINAKGLNIYITGDTLYNNSIFETLDSCVDVLCVCINGVGNNMNIDDAYRFTARIRPKLVIPMHWGMFEQADANPEQFIKKCKAKNINACKLQPYNEVILENLMGECCE